MAHRQKYNRKESGHLLEHDCREPHDRSRGNQDIDPNRTHLNYDLMKEHRDSLTAKQRLDAITDKYADIFQQKHGRKMRADAVNMCSWIVTVPDDVSPEEYQSFFRHTFDFISEKYGMENMIAATVHMDETTPHCHYCYAPVVPDELFINHENSDFHQKLCQRNSEMGTLSKFQKELQKHLEEALGHSVSILRDDEEKKTSKEGNKSIKQLKEETRKAHADALKAQQDSQQLLEQMQADVLADEYRQRAIDYYNSNPEPPVEPKKPRIQYGKVLERYEKDYAEYKKNLKLYEDGEAIVTDEGIEKIKQLLQNKENEVQQKEEELIQKEEKFVTALSELSAAKSAVDKFKSQLDGRQSQIDERGKQLDDLENQLNARQHNLDEEVQQRVAEQISAAEEYNQKLQHRADLLNRISAQDSFSMLQNRQALRQHTQYAQQRQQQQDVTQTQSNQQQQK